MQNGKKDSNTLENWLADYIESPANSVIDKIRNSLPITADEKFTMSIYMYVMLKRVLHHVPRHSGLFEKVCNEIVTEINQGEFPKIFLDTYSKKYIIQVVDNLKNSDIKNLYLSSITDLSKKIINAIYRMNWKFLTFKGERDFIKCDNPFAFDEGQGLGDSQAEITFPVSSHVVIWATWLNGDVDLQYFPTLQHIADIVNWRTYKVSTKYIFYHAKKEWVTKRANSDDLILSF